MLGLYFLWQWWESWTEAINDAHTPRRRQAQCLGWTGKLTQQVCLVWCHFPSTHSPPAWPPFKPPFCPFRLDMSVRAGCRQDKGPDTKYSTSAAKNSPTLGGKNNSTSLIKPHNPKGKWAFWVCGHGHVVIQQCARCSGYNAPRCISHFWL